MKALNHCVCCLTGVLFSHQEQVEWAVEAGVDYILGETFNELGEAMLALEVIKEFGKGNCYIIKIQRRFVAKGLNGKDFQPP